MNRGPRVLVAFLVLAGIATLFWSASFRSVAKEELPLQLSDEAFWKLTTDFSEPGGFFRSDNFVSNEDGFQIVIPELKKKTKPGGVYLGVGPDQNFTYIIAIQPRIAFIFDIRRQNMMQHLMYKALLEMAADRAEFASLLFSRKRPEGLTAKSSPEELFTAFDAAAADPELHRANLKAVLEKLKKGHGFKLSSEDEQSIEYVFNAFYEAGPQITYSSNSFRGGRRRMPNYEELMMVDDGTGLNRSYMANDVNFQYLRGLEQKNLIVPLAGDFAGDKAIRTVGEYLKEHGATVTAFYLSNVEQYLFQDNDNWKKFYANVGTLPLDSTSTFIRSVFNGPGTGFAGGGFGFMRSQNLLSSMTDTMKAYRAGKITTYPDVIRMSHP